jgi:hypothetical protein
MKALKINSNYFLFNNNNKFKYEVDLISNISVKLLFLELGEWEDVEQVYLKQNRDE